MEPVSIDYAVLESQGWKVEELSEFYANYNFMHTTDSIGTVYISRDDVGAINRVYAVFDNDIEKLSLTVNDITFSNFTEQEQHRWPGHWLRADIESPIDKKIQVYMYEVSHNKKIYQYSNTYQNFDHSGKRSILGSFSFREYGWNGELPSPIIVLNVQFLPTPKRGEKITQTTGWIPVGEERKIQLPKFAVFMKVEQLRPRGELILTARLDDSTGVTMSDAYKNHETITINLKFEDGSIWGELYSASLRKNLLQIMSSPGTEIGKTTVKLDSWQATIESTPLLQD